MLYDTIRANLPSVEEDDLLLKLLTARAKPACVSQNALYSAPPRSGNSLIRTMQRGNIFLADEFTPGIEPTFRLSGPTGPSRYSRVQQYADANNRPIFPVTFDP